MDPVRPSLEFRKEVIDSVFHGARLLGCIQCGACSGSCPNGAEMDATPRRIIALINAGVEEPVLSANTMWKCVSCYFCTSRCPQEIPITDIMYALKNLAVRGGYAHDEEACSLAETFTDNVDRYGRSFELGVASRYYMTNKPANLLRMGPLGVSLYRRGRVSLRPTKIRGIRQLQAILRRARELSGGDE